MLTEPDFERIFESAMSSWRKAVSGTRGQSIHVSDGLEYWIMVETEKYLKEWSSDGPR